MCVTTRPFNTDKVVRNLYDFMEGSSKEYLPHHVTLKEYPERLAVEELENIMKIKENVDKDKVTVFIVKGRKENKFTTHFYSKKVELV